MAKSMNQKLKLLCLLEILKRKTDEAHPMAASELIEELAKYDIRAERKSIYDDIRQLTDYGYDIVLSASKTMGGYYMASGEFELAELKLLVDSVQASRFITQKKSRELIQKLEKMCSIYDESQLKRQVYVSNRVKTDNESIYYNVDKIYQSIHENKQIIFTYYEWTMEKKKRPKKDGSKYQISPWALTWNEENYYLIAYDETHGTIRHYRVDKMKDIELLEESRLGTEEFQNFDVASYCKKTFGMYGGREEIVTLRLPEHLAGVIIDRFGTEISMRKMEDGFFTIRLEIAVSSQFFGWLAGIGPDAVIVSPEHLRKEYQEYLQNIIENQQIR